MADGQALPFNPKLARIFPLTEITSRGVATSMFCSSQLPGISAAVATTFDPPAPHVPARVVFSSLFDLVHPPPQTAINNIPFFDGPAGALRFLKKFDTGSKHPLVWT